MRLDQAENHPCTPQTVAEFRAEAQRRDRELFRNRCDELTFLSIAGVPLERTWERVFGEPFKGLS